MESVPFIDYLKWPQVSGSLLVHAYKSWRQFRYVQQHGYTPKTPTRVGTALHSMVELLPVERFQDLFCIMPDFGRSPDNVDGKGNPSTSANTKWAKLQRAAFEEEAEGRQVLSRTEYNRAVRMLESIQRCGEAMELIEAATFKEASVTANLCGVQCKGRMDVLLPGHLLDVKSTRDIAPHAFGRTCANLHYLEKMALYWMLLDQRGYHVDRVTFLAVQDSKPLIDGVTYNDAPDCCLVNVPMIAIENAIGTVERLLTELRQCEESGEWPGVPNHDLVVPNWAMADAELVD